MSELQDFTDEQLFEELKGRYEYFVACFHDKDKMKMGFVSGGDPLFLLGLLDCGRDDIMSSLRYWPAV
jgi:hypothetical protein